MFPERRYKNATHNVRSLRDDAVGRSKRALLVAAAIGDGLCKMVGLLLLMLFGGLGARNVEAFIDLKSPGRLRVVLAASGESGRYFV